MAKLGEGDARWIVEDRQDGTNVNQWHWTEKDCLAWSRQRLEELFSGAQLVDGMPCARVTGLEALEGDATLNVRKKKLIPIYELKLTLTFEGEASGERVTGKVVLPYIAEENHDEDPEVQVLLDKDSSAGRQCKDAIYNSRAKGVLPRVKTFVDEFHAGKPAGHESASKEVAEPAGASKAPAPKASPNASAAAGAGSSAARSEASAPAAAPKKNARGRGQSLTLKETFYASAGDIYECLTDAGRIKAFTQSDAQFERTVGGKFTMFGGSVEGVNRELVPGKRIAQDWRFTTWPDGISSKVELDIAESSPGHTTVTLRQEGIPEEDKFGNHEVLRTTEHGWRQLIFYRIRAVFGYGM